jgi:hypothetical protein
MDGFYYIFKQCMTIMSQPPPPIVDCPTHRPRRQCLAGVNSGMVVETEAHLVNGEFVINTPKASSAKNWISQVCMRASAQRVCAFVRVCLCARSACRVERTAKFVNSRHAHCLPLCSHRAVLLDIVPRMILIWYFPYYRHRLLPHHRCDDAPPTQGLVADEAVVVATLFVNGKNHGAQAFLVQMRDDAGKLAVGIGAEDMGASHV